MTDLNLKECIEVCQSCEIACNSCANYCIDKPEMADCIRLCLDCAEICNACATFCESRSHFVNEVARVCAAICEVCAKECEKYDEQPIKQSAVACRKCANVCSQMAP